MGEHQPPPAGCAPVRRREPPQPVGGEAAGKGSGHASPQAVGPASHLSGGDRPRQRFASDLAGARVLSAERSPDGAGPLPRRCASSPRKGPWNRHLFDLLPSGNPSELGQPGHGEPRLGRPSQGALGGAAQRGYGKRGIPRFLALGGEPLRPVAPVRAGRHLRALLLRERNLVLARSARGADRAPPGRRVVRSGWGRIFGQWLLSRVAVSSSRGPEKRGLGRPRGPWDGRSRLDNGWRGAKRERGKNSCAAMCGERASWLGRGSVDRPSGGGWVHSYIRNASRGCSPCLAWFCHTRFLKERKYCRTHFRK